LQFYADQWEGSELDSYSLPLRRRSGTLDRRYGPSAAICALFFRAHLLVARWHRLGPLTTDGRAAPRRTRSSGAWLLSAALALFISGCGSGTQSGNSRASTDTPGKHEVHHPSATTTTTVPPTTTTTDQPGWTPVSRESTGIAIDERTITGPLGGAVTVIRFRSGFIHFDLHVGATDPTVGSASIPPDARSVIGPDEVPLLLASFNGGFKESSHAGGFELDGQVLNPLVPGLASFVIDDDGATHIGVWGEGLPAPGEQVESVRQNLSLLVSGGVASPTVANSAAWGAMLGPGPAVARSALGQDSEGDVLYAAGMSLTPTDLAAALVEAGAVSAMELDINPEWVQADAAPNAGAPIVALIPGQNRPADQYQLGWTRDFITAIAAH